MSNYPYESTHIPGLTPNIIQAVIENPDRTYEALDALEFAILNSDEPGMGHASPYIEVVSNAIREIIYGE
jgi:hypothetical protein